MVFKDWIVGPDKPNIPKPPTPPSTSSGQIQQSELDARRRALLARGRSSTILTGTTQLGSVGQ